MCKKEDVKVTDIIKTLLCTAVFTISVLPGYSLLGNLTSQIIATILISLLSVLVIDKLLNPKPIVFAHALIIMTVFWITVAIIKQIIFHINNGGFTFRWYQLFYYDRPALLFVVFFVCIMYFIVKLLINKDNKQFINAYSKFIKQATKGFLAYYIVILIYTFFMVRVITFERPQVNLIPFEMMTFTFDRDYPDYELIFLFLGNLAIFFPLGVLVSAFIKNRLLLAILPVVISFSIEVSQYFLGNGHPDVDDLILNVIGFYLGVFVKKLIDFLVVKATHGYLNSFFCF